LLSILFGQNHVDFNIMSILRKTRIYYGWWILVSSCVMTSLSGMALFGFFSFYPSFIETLGWGRTQVVIASTLLLWTFGAMGLVWGAVADKYGVRVLLTIGTVCVAVAHLLYTQMTSLWQLYAIATLSGAGLSALGYLPNQILQSNWFARRRGLAIGIVTAASALGGAIAPAAITYLIIRVGWRGTLGLMDVLFWTIPFLLILFVIKNRPEDIGLNPDGDPAPATVDVSRREAQPASGSSGFRGIFLTPVFWAIIAALFFAGGTIGTTLQLLIVHLRDSGFSPQAAASALSLEISLSFVGRLAFGILSDRFSVRKVGLFVLVLLGLSILLLPGVGIPAVVIAFAIIHGLAHGGVVSFNPLIMSAVFEDKRYLGRLIAIGLLTYTAGMGTMPVVTSYAFDSTGSYNLGFALNCVLVLSAATAFWLLGAFRRTTVAVPSTP
jgi:sugar phosphate permease